MVGAVHGGGFMASWKSLEGLTHDEGKLVVHHLASELWSGVSTHQGSWESFCKKAWEGVIYHPILETGSNLYSFRVNR